jgi:hypothetical protein
LNWPVTSLNFVDELANFYGMISVPLRIAPVKRLVKLTGTKLTWMVNGFALGPGRSRRKKRWKKSQSP